MELELLKELVNAHLASMSRDELDSLCRRVTSLQADIGYEEWRIPLLRSGSYPNLEVIQDQARKTYPLLIKH